MDYEGRSRQREGPEPVGEVQEREMKGRTSCPH